jgi:hypothetical protein
VDIHNHWLRQEVARKVIKVKYVPSDNIIADGFTKALLIAKWLSFLNQVGLVRRTEPQLKEVDVNELQERLEGLIVKD